MDDAFRVRACGELVSVAKQILAKFRIVVDFAVQHHPNAAVFIRNRLVTAGDIDDAQAPKTQPDARSRVNPFVIRASMNNCLRHPADEIFRDLSRRLIFENAAYSTHKLMSRASSLRLLSLQDPNRDGYNRQPSV